MADRLGDAAWARFLAAKGIDLATAQLPLRFTTAELKALSGREPRLLLFMDTRDKWPRPLREHGVFPLSVTGSEVLLLRGDGWLDFPPPPSEAAVFEARLPADLARSTGRGENEHIMRLHAAGYLQKFLGTGTLVPFFSGKRATPAFTVRVQGAPVHVQGAGYEVDQAYSTVEEVVLVEAKQQHYPGCAIRQLYYPWRATGEDEGWSRAVRLVFLTHDAQADDYVVRELAFEDRDEWQSLRQVHAERVRLNVVAPQKGILDFDAPPLGNPRIPQADNVAWIEQLPELVKLGVRKGSLVAQHFGVHARQASYYRDAAQALGLVEFDEATNEYGLTADGTRYLQLAPQARADHLARRMSRLPVMRAVLERIRAAGRAGLPHGELPGILQAYAEGAGEPLNATTAQRRASTIRAYLSFIGTRTGAVVRTPAGRWHLREHLPSLDSFL